MSSNAELARNFASISRPKKPTFLTHLAQDGKPVRVTLEERVGNLLWVRPLDEGEPEPAKPILVGTKDTVVPFTPIHSTSINTSPTVGDTTGFVVGIPVVEVRRDDVGRKIWLRTLKLDEPRASGRVRAPWGYEVIFEPGSVVVEVEWIDKMFEPDADGYAPLTNTIWTWMSIGPSPETATLSRYLLAAARRLDVAHRRFQRIRQDLDEFDQSAPGPHARLAIFEIVGEVEITVVALSRAVEMAMALSDLAPITTPIPPRLIEAHETLTALRNAYEHIEDRAKGQIMYKPNPQALTIFDWSSLFKDNAITYASHRLDLGQVPSLLLDTRTFLKVAGAEAKSLLDSSAVELESPEDLDGLTG